MSPVATPFPLSILCPPGGTQWSLAGGPRPRSARSTLSSGQAHRACLTASSKSRPGTAPGSARRRVPAIRHPVSARQRPANPGRETDPRPVETSCPSGQAHCDRLVATGRSSLAGHRQPANGRASCNQAHCARPRVTSGSVPAVHRRPADARAPSERAHGARLAVTRRYGECHRARLPRGDRRRWRRAGGEAWSRRRCRSTWSVASRCSVPFSAAVPARLSPRDTRFSEQTRASNQSHGILSLK